MNTEHVNGHDHTLSEAYEEIVDHVGQIGHAASEALESTINRQSEAVRVQLKEHPLRTIGIAFCVGYVLAKLR